MTTSEPLLIVGSVAFDNVKTPLGEVKEALGGAAVYSSVAASFFTTVKLVGVVGEDFPEEHVAFLERRGIDCEGLQRVPGKTFRWSGYYEYDLNQAHTTDTQLNVFAEFSPRLPDGYRDAKYVFLANIDPTLQLQVLDQVKAPKLAVCDTMNFWIETKKPDLLKVLERVDIAFMNDAEARQLCGTSSVIKAARQIREIGPRCVVIKKGEHGALLFTEEAFFSAPSYPLDEVVDPTGAGDSFAGGFMGYVASTDDASEANLRKAIVCGSTVASYNVEDFSLGRMSKLTRDDIACRYDEFRDICRFEGL